MKQKLIIAFSVILLVSAVILIAHDLFRKTPAFTTTACCGDDVASLKKIDSVQIGYYKAKVIETGMKDLSGISVSEDLIFLCGNKEIALFDTGGARISGFTTDSMNSCITSFGNIIYVGAGSSVTSYDKSGTKMIVLQSVNNKGYITSIAANDRFVFIADAINKRVLKYSADGDLVQVIGQKDSISGVRGFIIPSAYFDVTIGGFDDLWIVNPGRLEVENYTETGYLRSSWGRSSSEDNGFVGCCNPAHMAVLQDGSFVTYEKGTDKIKLFDAAGQFRCFIGGAGSFRGNPDFLLGKNNLVKDLAADRNGSIYVLDAYNRINIFRPIV